MSRKLAGLACALLLCLPLAATAAPVTWNFTGGLTGVANAPPSGIPSFITPGAQFNLALTFDPNSFSRTVFGFTQNPDNTCLTGAPLQAGGCFTRNQAFGPPPDPQLKDTIGFSLDFGQDCDSLPGYQTCSPATGSTGIIFKFDNFDDGSLVYDGLRFVVFSNGLRWKFDLAGPTDIFTSAAGLPTAADSRFSFRQVEICGDPNAQSGFGVCGDTAFRVVGNINVPEPATLGLLGIGLAGLGITRRRRRIA